MNDSDETVNVSGKNPEQIYQLQIKEIILVVEKNDFIYNKKHKNYFKKGKRTLFWFKTTAQLNKQFPGYQLTRKLA